MLDPMNILLVEDEICTLETTGRELLESVGVYKSAADGCRLAVYGS